MIKIIHQVYIQGYNESRLSSEVLHDVDENVQV